MASRAGEAQPFRVRAGVGMALAILTVLTPASAQKTKARDGGYFYPCVDGYTFDDEGRRFQCDKVGIASHQLQSTYSPYNDSSVGIIYRRYGDISVNLCEQCIRSGKDHHDRRNMGMHQMTHECIDAVVSLRNENGPCSEERVQSMQAEQICYDCYSAIGGGHISEVCKTTFYWYCDHEIGQNDIWGWTGDEGNHYYAIVGMRHGIIVFDVSDPYKPVKVGYGPQPVFRNPENPNDPKVYTVAPSWWRDLKIVKRRYLYVGSEAFNHGIRIYDLQQLSGWSGTNNILQEAYYYNNISNSHNLIVDDESAYVYAVGSWQWGCGGGLHVIDVDKPLEPKTVTCYTGSGYIHDCHCTYYNGPDTEFRGSELCFCGALTCGMLILDVSNKNNIQQISCTAYANMSFPHQGRLTGDQRFFLMGDEGDEASHQINTTTLVWNVQSLRSPQLVSMWSNPHTISIDHNLFIDSGVVFEANYESGVRILKFNPDATTPDGYLKELGYLDIFANRTTRTTFAGTWGAWAIINSPDYPADGFLAISDEQQGFFTARIDPSIIVQMNDRAGQSIAPTSSPGAKPGGDGDGDGDGDGSGGGGGSIPGLSNRPTVMPTVRPTVAPPPTSQPIPRTLFPTPQPIATGTEDGRTNAGAGGGGVGKLGVGVVFGIAISFVTLGAMVMWYFCRERPGASGTARLSDMEFQEIHRDDTLGGDDDLAAFDLAIGRAESDDFKLEKEDEGKRGGRQRRSSDSGLLTEEMANKLIAQLEAAEADGSDIISESDSDI